MFIDTLIALGSTVIVLGVLIFIHELGHFLVAKKVGIKVEKFSLGFPPNLYEKKKGETSYCIGMIPLGGYVKMAGEQPDETATGASNEFMSKSVGQRTAVIFAGPFMNYVLTMVILFFLYFAIGADTYDKEKIIIGEIVEEGPAATAGLKIDDIVIAVNDQNVNQFESMAALINPVVNDEITLTWINGNDTISSSMITYAEPRQMPDASIDTVGLIGIRQKVIGKQRFGFIESVENSWLMTHMLVWETIKFVKKYITREVPADMVGGPIFIAQQSGEHAKKGISKFLLFMALLSVNLAVLNVLPIPVLDGGHLVFLLVEKIRGSPLSIKVRMMAQQVGLVLLMGMVLVVTYNDIVRFFK